MRIFISYARPDRSPVSELAEGIERLDHTVWFDRSIHGGQSWWDEILDKIRASDTLLVALSPSSLESGACMSELRYAHQLHKPLLPVLIQPVRTELLPPELARLHFVDCTTANQQWAFELAAALARLPAAPPLPDPLPDPPPVPISYLSGLSQQVNAETLTPDEQLVLVTRLRAALQKPKEREAAIELVQRLRARPDLYAATEREIEMIPQVAVEDASLAETAERGRRYRVDVLEKVDRVTRTVRRFSITGRDRHPLDYVRVSRGLRDWESVSLDGTVVEERRLQASPWQLELEDGGDVLPMGIWAEYDFPRITSFKSTIVSFKLTIAGELVYSEGG